MAHLFDPNGIFDIDNLSILLNVKSWEPSNILPVQLTGSRTANARTAIGTNIFKLQPNVTLDQYKKEKATY